MIELRVLLSTVDRNWIDHIDAMDQLRKGIGLRAYGQVDPIISYKKEGFDMFDEMVERIQRTTISILLKARIEIAPQPQAGARPTANAPAQTAGRTAHAKPFRRQMPVSLSSMSSQQNQTENKEDN